MFRSVNRMKKASKNPSPQVVAVAVSSNKNSHNALKWAADNVIPKGQIFFLIHVRKKITAIPTPTGEQLPISEVNEEVASAFLRQIDMQTKELLLPFQCFCSRRLLQCKEIILDELDISKAIIDYVVLHSIDKLVLGASSRNTFTRAFKSADIPTSIMKLAPDFCCVYIISKSKVSLSRAATRTNSHPQKSTSDLEVAGNSFQSAKSEPIPIHVEEFARNQHLRNSRILYRPERNFCPQSNENLIDGNINLISQSTECRDLSNYSAISCPSPSRSIDNQAKLFRTCDLSCHHNEQARHLGPNRFGEKYYSSGSGFSGYGPSLMGSNRTFCSSRSQAQDLHTSNVCEERRMEPTRFSRESATGIKVQNQDRRFLMEAEQVFDSLSMDVPFRRYAIQEIQNATDNFSEKLKIGEGGYGPVFKANLHNTLVAIKILHGDGSQGMKQFQQEVEVLSCIRHPNMVLLIGACPDRGCLVYEYMANGSLEDRLFCYDNTHPLSWQLRFKIASEIASGLLFLHEMKPEPLVHRDLKPANILLDHNFVSKIADVGLARLVPRSVADAVTQYRQTAAAGTFCYIDPEYQQTGLVGIKSDIYALGIILLQLLTAQPPMGLAHNAEKTINDGMFEQMLDPLVPDWPVEKALKLAEVALKCSELRRKDRPDMRQGVLPVLTWLKEFADQVEA